MNPNEMIFKLPQFEIKDLSEKDWKKVSGQGLYYP